MYAYLHAMHAIGVVFLFPQGQHRRRLARPRPPPDPAQSRGQVVLRPHSGRVGCEVACAVARQAGTGTSRGEGGVRREESPAWDMVDCRL